jgi:hypothetical protein
VWSITQKFMCEWSMKSHLYVTNLIGDHKRLYLVKSCTVCGRSCKMVLLLHISVALNKGSKKVGSLVLLGYYL